MIRAPSLTLSTLLILAALGCQRGTLEITADSPAVTVSSPAPIAGAAAETVLTEAPEIPELTDKPPTDKPPVVAAPEATATPAVPVSEPAKEELALADAVAIAPVPTAVAVAPLAAAVTIGPPKTMAPPKIPFSINPRAPEMPPTERQGKLDLYKPVSPAVDFVPKRLPEETAIPAIERPVLDEPELSRGENARPSLPVFPRGLGARKPSVNPSAIPPLAPLSVPQQEKVLAIDDPGSRATRGATQPPAQPVKPEIAPADPRPVDPDENERLFRLGVPPPETDPPASAPPARPILPVAPVPTIPKA